MCATRQHANTFLEHDALAVSEKFVTDATVVESPYFF